MQPQMTTAQNEVAWRHHKEREAVALADQGPLPPLYPRHAKPLRARKAGARGAEADYGSTLGTDALEPGPLRCVPRVRMCVGVCVSASVRPTMATRWARTRWSRGR